MLSLSKHAAGFFSSLPARRPGERREPSRLDPPHRASARTNRPSQPDRRLGLRVRAVVRYPDCGTVCHRDPAALRIAFG